MLNPYQRLSQIYDEGWSFFADSYSGLVRELFSGGCFHHCRALDIACGTGTLALKLARQGFSVVGVDSSPEMIAVAQAKVEPELSLCFEVQNMEELDVKGPFDLILCTFDSLNYLLSEKDVAQFLDRVSSVLKLSGFFMFDSVTEAMYRNKHYKERSWELGGTRFLQKLSYNSRRKIAITRFQFEDGEEEIHLQKPYGLRELIPLLHNAGFVICDKFSGLKGESYQPGSERLIYITRKKGNL